MSTVLHLLELPEALLALVLSSLPAGRSLCNALETHRILFNVGRADPCIWVPLSMQHSWLLRHREADAPVALYQRAHCGVVSERLVCIGGDEGGSMIFHAGSSVISFDMRTQVWEDLPNLRRARNAPCAAADTAAGVIYTAGGWCDDEDGSLDSTDSLSVPRVGGNDTVCAPRQWYANEDWRWDAAAPLSSARCFGAALCDGSGRLWVCGGGDALSRGAYCSKAIEACSEPREPSAQFESMGEMIEPRCGLALAADARSSVLYLVGGYSGGMSYQNTVETFDMSSGAPASQLPPMSHARSGCGAGCGPDGALYVVGGSDDGSNMLSSCERLDPREGVWQTLSDLSESRGYLAACFALDGALYTAGGCGMMGQSLDTFHAFDTRAGRWRDLPPMPTARSNHALVHIL